MSSGSQQLLTSSCKWDALNLLYKQWFFLQICERCNERHRLAGDPAVLHVIGIVPGDVNRGREGRGDQVPSRDEKDCPDIQDHEDIQDIQAGEAHNGTEDPGADTAAQVGDENVSMLYVCYVCQLQRAWAADVGGDHGHVDLQWAGLRGGEG